MSYLKSYFSTIVILFFLIGSINFFVDPLWYFQGNQLTGINPSWNERLTKTNLFLHSQNKNYDCLIFGTSRVTLLNANSLQKNHCFNYSFSAGKIEEFIKYAQYIKRKRFDFHKIYVGVEPFKSTNFKKNTDSLINIMTDPQPVYQTYLFSWNTLWLSLKTIAIKYPHPRFYDQNFIGQVADWVPAYKPEKLKKRLDNNYNSCDLSKVELYKKLINIFPNAEFIGFIPPVSAWKVVNTRYAPGLLKCQLEGIHQLSKFFDVMYDFSIPSEETTRTDNTYDGSHYYPEVYNKIARTMEGNRSSFGIQVNEYTLVEYQKLYFRQLQSFLKAKK